MSLVSPVALRSAEVAVVSCRSPGLPDGGASRASGDHSSLGDHGELERALEKAVKVICFIKLWLFSTQPSRSSVRRLCTAVLLLGVVEHGLGVVQAKPVAAALTDAAGPDEASSGQPGSRTWQTFS